MRTMLEQFKEYAKDPLILGYLTFLALVTVGAALLAIYLILVVAPTPPHPAPPECVMALGGWSWTP